MPPYTSHLTREDPYIPYYTRGTILIVWPMLQKNPTVEDEFISYFIKLFKPLTVLSVKHI